MSAAPLVLSIQSHVAYGHVGNRAAVFPLERLGVEVMPVHTVQLSNHTGYPSFPGDVFGAAHVARVLGGVAERGAFALCDAVLSGYLGDAALAAVVADAVDAVKAARPGAIYACDPVMGDRDGGLYVSAEIPAAMREKLLPRADVLTPNHFELELLAGGSARTLTEVLDAAAALRRLGPALILVTSMAVEGAAPDSVSLLLSTPTAAWRVDTPRVDFEVEPNGAGDLVSALFLGRLLQTRDPVAALEHMAAAVAAVFEHTRRAGRRELALVQAQAELVNPTRPVRALRVA
jgi:pyridoxine kinase